MKHYRIWLPLFLLILALGAMSVAASAAGTETVVYLANGGSGNGTSAESPVGSLPDAYAALDLSKDCTVVICGEFTQTENFAYGKDYTGSVTLTSVYGGTDYRDTADAIYRVSNKRFFLYGETTIENMHFNVTTNDKKYCHLLIIARHKKVTVGEGVEITGDTLLTGGAVANSFSILGGYQDETSTAANSKDTDITVLSGSKIYIVAFARGESKSTGGPKTYTGTANIKIGGNAGVSGLLLSGVDRNNIDYGTTKVEITDNATVGTIYGATQKVTLNGFELTWRSGTIGKFVPALSGASIAYTEGSALKAAAAVRTESSFDAIAKQFDSVACIDHAFGDWEPTTPADFGVPGVKTRTCAYCDATETDTIPAITAKLVLGENSLSAMTDEAGVGTIRMIATLVTTEDANVTNYGIFVAKTDAIGTAVKIDYTETTGTETAFVLDLTAIPHDKLDIAIYAWAFVNVDGEQITLPILVGQSVDDILPEKEA